MPRIRLFCRVLPTSVCSTRRGAVETGPRAKSKSRRMPGTVSYTPTQTQTHIRFRVDTHVRVYTPDATKQQRKKNVLDHRNKRGAVAVHGHEHMMSQEGGHVFSRSHVVPQERQSFRVSGGPELN